MGGGALRPRLPALTREHFRPKVGARTAATDTGGPNHWPAALPRDTFDELRASDRSFGHTAIEVPTLAPAQPTSPEFALSVTVACRIG